MPNAKPQKTIDELGRFASVKEVAEVLRVHQGTVRRWVREGQLAAMKTAPGKGGRVLISRASVQAFLHERDLVGKWVGKYDQAHATMVASVNDIRRAFEKTGTPDQVQLAKILAESTAIIHEVMNQLAVMEEPMVSPDVPADVSDDDDFFRPMSFDRYGWPKFKPIRIDSRIPIDVHDVLRRAFEVLRASLYFLGLSTARTVKDIPSDAMDLEFPAAVGTEGGQ